MIAALIVVVASSSCSCCSSPVAAVKVAREYERGVIFRLGRLLAEPKGPGLFILIPIVDRMVKVDLRTITLNIPPQEVITKDNVPARVNAVAYFRIVDPKDAIVQVENFMVATSQIAQTTLRSVLGQHLLDELLSERDKINAILQEIIDEATAPWGIKVSIVEVKDVEIPPDMQRAMARQAEAERERRAKVINAEGEFQASERLKDAALVIEDAPDRAPAPLPADAARDRLVATSTTIVFPAPIDLITPFLERGARATSRPSRATRSTGRRRRRSRRRARSGRAPCPAARAADRRRSSSSARSARGARTGRRRRRSRLGDGRWQVRVVPNLYPAFERQEVVVHAPRHVRSLAELADDELDARRGGVATAHARREPRARLPPRARQRGPRARARACRTRTRSSSGSASRRRARRGDGEPAPCAARRERVASAWSRSATGRRCSRARRRAGCRTSC